MLIQPNAIVFDGEGNKYKVLDYVGNGSFGYVYKIIKESDDTILALKTLPSHFPNNQQLQSFLNESSMAVRVSHENAIKYSFIHDGTLYPELPPYIIMEYADGGTLQDLVRLAKENNQFISNSELLDYFHQLINGMEHINSVLIHRDIKLDNILLNDGIIKVSDFGLSKIVHDGTRQLTFKGFGHIKYMSPEGWKGEKNTIQMDIYSMGITFYELATLQHPYSVPENADVQEWRNAHYFNNPISPITINRDITTSMAQVISKMMEKSTTKRYKTWDEVRKDLLIDNEPPTENTLIVDNMINIRISRDASIRNEQLKQEKENEEKLEYLNTINYQYANDIYNRIKEFIEEFNKKYTSGKIKMTSLDSMKSSEIFTKIQLISGKTLTINLKALFDHDFVRDVPVQFESGRTFKKVVRPQLRDRKILAWGYLKDNDNRGFNILLVENKDDLYGEWIILTNTNSGFARKGRPEPFPFEFNELEKEIQLIFVTHIYNTEVRTLEMERFIEFIILNN